MREHRIRRTKTVCTYCGVGCSFDVWTKDRHILKVEPEHGPANGISTCVKGKFALGLRQQPGSPDHAAHPRGRHVPRGELGRGARVWSPAGCPRSRPRAGPTRSAFISSSKCTNEESYLMQKLARAVIGTNNIDNCSRYCQSPATAGLFRTVGYGGDSGSIADIEQADLVIIIGSNTAESHPVLATRVKRAHKLHGQKLIVSDLREHEMARRADLFLHPQARHRPGLAVGGQPLPARPRSGRTRRSSSQWVNGLDEYRKSLEPFTLEFASRICGLPVETLEARGAHDRGGGARLHPLGDGRHPAHQRVRHVDRDLEPAARHRQLHAAGHRRVSAARAQQRAGRERQRIDAEHVARLSVGRRSGGAGALRSRRGACRCRRPRAWTTTRWSRPSTRASSRRCT